MTQITLNIPDNEIDFFLKLAKKFNYTISDDDFELTTEQIALLDKSSAMGNADCMTKEQLQNHLKNKYAL